MKLTALPKELTFWDGFAPYYEIWSKRTSYHRPIVAELSSMVEPGWKVLDIGAATGPLVSLGCKVTALEPSQGMREIFFRKIKELKIQDIEVLPLRWEDYEDETEFDLVIASNSLHLYRDGLLEGAKKVFNFKPAYFCFVTEIGTFPIDFREVDRCTEGFEFLYIKTFETDSLCKDKVALELLKAHLSDPSLHNESKTKLSILWWERK